jgi:hypothetical protein
MTGDRLAGMAVVISCLALVGSSLVARRLPLRRTVILAGAWIGIFAIAALIAHWVS